jgi:hypothetical protein
MESRLAASLSRTPWPRRVRLYVRLTRRLEVAGKLLTTARERALAPGGADSGSVATTASAAPTKRRRRRGGRCESTGGESAVPAAVRKRSAAASHVCPSYTGSGADSGDPTAGSVPRASR